MRELAADEEARRRERVRVRERDTPKLGGHREVCGGGVERCNDDKNHGLHHFTSRHCMSYTAPQTMSNRVSTGKMAMAPEESVQP